jgi:arylsulfatase A-like enzyme
MRCMKPFAWGMLMVLLPGLVGAQETKARPPGRRPNILLVITDDQGYGDLGLHGNPHVRTPHIDGLGRRSIRMDRFYVNAFCAPTRASLLTGRYSLRSGVWGVTHNKEAMRPEEVTLAELLRGAGYATACIGKWHNGEQFPYTPTGQGFEHFFGFHNGHWNNYFDSELLRGARFEKTKGFITDVLTDEAAAFIRKHRERPFLCYLAYNAPHSPFQVPDRYFDKHKAKGLDDRVAAYYGMIENIDDNVGRLLALLDELQLAEDTIVIFMTDNGSTVGAALYNAGMRGNKGSVHEGGCRVPFFLRWPARFHEPRVYSEIAAHIDVLPTLLDLCGVHPPPAREGRVRGHGPPLDGISLRPLWEGKAWPERMLFTHHPTSASNRYPGAVRTPQYRLVREAKGAKAKANEAAPTAWQLYDMHKDPGETQDLAHRLPEEVARLSKLYEAWFDDVSRAGRRRFPLPVGHPQENPVTLHAPQAYYDGSLKFFAGPGFAHDWLTGWTDVKSRIWFEIDVARAGDYDAALQYLCPPDQAGSRIRLSSGAASVEGKVAPAPITTIPLPHRDGGKATYINRAWASLPLGRLRLQQGVQRLTVEALDLAAGEVMDFKGLVLQRKDAK